MTKNLTENARFLAQIAQIEYADYERFKAVLARLPLSEEQYTAALK